MFRSICENILLGSGTVLGCFVMFAISYAIFISLADEFNLKLPWRDK